jgi:Tol biopolymer transport system component
MTDHDDFDRSLSERLRAYEARLPGGAAPDLATIGSGTARERPAWGWGALAGAGGVAAGLLLVIFLGGRLQPPTGQATATPQPTSSASGSVAPSASVAPSPPSLSSLPGLIAFSRDGDVYTMRPDGSAVTRLTDDPASTSGPVAWLTDGSRLVIARSDNVSDPNAPYPSTLTLVLPDGTDPIEVGIVSQQYAPPTYSPDGTIIAFGGDGTPGSQGIVVLDLARGTLTQLSADGGHGWDALNGPLWSPDGMSIAYQAYDGTSNDVRVVGLDGSPPVTLAPDPSEDFPIRWADVDGTLKLVFNSWRGTDQSKFAARPWVVNADGTDVQLLAESGLSSLLANHVLPSRTSPDGRWVMSTCDGRLCVTPTDGSRPQRIIVSAMISDGMSSPSFSADSAFLVYAAAVGIDQGTYINVLFLPDGDPIAITAPESNDTTPIWQPVQD